MNMDDEYQLMKYRQEIGADITIKDLIAAHRRLISLLELADGLCDSVLPDVLREMTFSEIHRMLNEGAA